MLRSDFSFDLPPDRIAQTPAEPRSSARLLCLTPDGNRLDRRVSDLPGFVAPGDLLVFNDTRVIPARLHGHKASGGRVELLVERLHDERRARVYLRASHAPATGSELLFDAARVRVLGREHDLFEVELVSDEPWEALLERAGEVPLPPYIERAADASDRERYQTLYARSPGAVAAPTAGLHFDADLLAALEARGVHRAYVTLHVGAGTFQPMRVEDPSQHRMHAERLEVPEATVAAINACRARGGRVLAVGTTVVRTLEAVAAAGELRPWRGETRLFITPGYRFRVVDRLLTNFHLPESTLLMLVCAFGGQEAVLAAYRHAVCAGYRFFSYGDAMLLDRCSAG